MAGASGDVLVTIKAKYESVDAALKSLQGIDKAISGINKKRINVDASRFKRELKTIVDEVQELDKALNQVVSSTKQTGKGYAGLGRTIKEVDGNLSSFRRRFNIQTTDAERQRSALGSLTAQYKRLRLEASAFAQASGRGSAYTGGKKNPGEFLGGPTTPSGRSRVGKDNWRPGFFSKRTEAGTPFDAMGVGSLPKRLASLAEFPKTLAATQARLNEINFLIDQAELNSEELNLLTDARNKALKVQESLEKKILGVQEKQVKAKQVATSVSKGGVMERGPFVPKTSGPLGGTAGMSIPSDLSIYKTGGVPGQMKDLDPAAKEWNLMVRKNAGTAKSIYQISRRLENALKAVLKNVGATEEDIANIRIEDIIKDLTFDPKKRGGQAGMGGLPGPLAQRLGVPQVSGYKPLLTDPRLAKAVAMMEDAGIDVHQTGDTTKGINTNFDELKKNLDAASKAAQANAAATKAETAAKKKMSGMFTPEARQARREAALPRARRMAMRRGLGGKTAQNYLLGGGFPMLFGGGAGAVGGSMMGAGLAQFMGMPGAGFGLQIMGSALGTMFEDSIKRVKGLSDAMNSLNMDSLIEQGIRFSSELQTQVELLREQGEIEKARALLEKQFQKQTGGTGQMGTDVANAVNMLSATWNDVRNAVSLTLGVLSVPFMAALALILDTVAMIFRGFNRVLGAVGSLSQAIYNVFPDSVKNAWEGIMDGLNDGLQKANAKADKLSRTLKKEADILRGELADEQMKIYQPKSIPGKLSNLYGARDKEYGEVFRQSRKREKQELSELDPLTDLLKIEEVQNRLKVVEQKQLDIITEKYAKQITALEIQRDIQNATHESTMESLRVENELAAEKHRLQNPEGLAAMFSQSNAQEIKRLEINSKILKIQGKIKILRVEESINAKAIAVEEQKITNLVAERSRLMTDAQVKMQQLYKNIGQTIEDSLVSGIDAVIDKTKSLTDVLSQALKQIGMMLIRMGIQSAIGSINFGGGGVNLPKTGGSTGVHGNWIKSGAKGWGFSNKAAGGYVDTPEISMIGEGGQGEYVIPENQMASALERYSLGARGDAVLAGDGAEESSGGGGVVTAGGPIDVRFTSERINSVEYVTFDQFQAGVQAAAQQGAKQGEMATLKRLKTNPGTRRGIGL